MTTDTTTDPARAAAPVPVVAVGDPGGPAHLAGITVATLLGARLPDGTLADLTLTDGWITGVRPAGAAAPSPTADGGTHLEASGWRFVPAASEPHAHLDKALTAPRMDPGAGNDLVSAVASWRELAPAVTSADVHERALAAVHRYAANGITTIRSHVDLPGEGDPMRGVDALLALREELSGRIRLQVCILAGSLTPDWAITEAVTRGVDVIGGCPHLSPDPRAETSRMLDVAERHGLPVDLHTDEQTDAPELDIVDLAEQVLARGLTQRVTASHCVRLGSLPPERLAPVLDLVARAGLGVVTLPITNLYLQGWDATHLAPRGLTALRALLDAGIPLAAGADNLRDPFNPAGRADPFETTALLMTAGHLRAGEALAAVTTGARTVLGLPQVGAAVGHAADLMLVPDGDLGDLLAGTPDARVVLHGGRVVADTRMNRSLDLFR
jgi:cytosine deaminase